MRRRDVIACGLAWAAFGAPSWADDPPSGKWDPLSGAEKLADWLEGLQQKFDAFASREEQAQTLRKLERLKRGLYFLEFDSRVLKESIPADRPDHAQILQLRELIGQLRDSLSRVRLATRDVGAELGSAPPAETALAQVEDGRRLRTLALDATDDMLLQAEKGQWEPQVIVDALERGLVGLHRAYVATDQLCARLAGRTANS